MTIARRDDYLTDAQGRALAGAQVYYCTQPASTGTIPPSPLTTVYLDMAGTIGVNPVITDGFGHAVAYLTAGSLYTIEFVHPLFGPNPVVLADQQVGSGSSGPLNPEQASTTAGTITGAIPGYTFVLPSTPASGSLILQRNGQVLTPGLTYTIVGATITLTSELMTGENLNANYLSSI